MPKAQQDPAIAVLRYFATAPIEVAKTTFAIARHTLHARLPKAASTAVAPAKKSTGRKGKKPVDVELPLETVGA